MARSPTGQCGVATRDGRLPLLIGGAGSDTVTDTGGGSCIVAGGGSNSITGTASDVCISGPTLNIAAPCPLANPSNGVVGAPTSSNSHNYGG